VHGDTVGDDGWRRSHEVELRPSVLSLHSLKGTHYCISALSVPILADKQKTRRVPFSAVCHHQVIRSDADYMNLSPVYPVVLYGGGCCPSTRKAAAARAAIHVPLELDSPAQ
jgi:hypothetical protein